MVVLDSRPFDEYQRVSIPTAVNVPGAELALRIHDLAPSPQTLVVVNCAGRTRSIIGAQSLINAGVPNKVVALRNGTMGWTLAGLACESGKARRAPTVSPAGLAWAKSAAAGVAARFGITRIDRATLERWRADASARFIFSTCATPANMRAAGAASVGAGSLLIGDECRGRRRSGGHAERDRRRVDAPAGVAGLHADGRGPVPPEWTRNAARHEPSASRVAVTDTAARWAAGT